MSCACKSHDAAECVRARYSCSAESAAEEPCECACHDHYQCEGDDCQDTECRDPFCPWNSANLGKAIAADLQALRGDA